MLNYPKCKIDVKEVNPTTKKEFTKFTLNIGNDVGDDLSTTLNNATTYINIISPYISHGYVETLNTLKYKNPNLDIRLIFSDKDDFFRRETEALKKLIELNWSVNPLKQEKQQKILKGINKNITFLRFFFIFEIFFAIFFLITFLYFNDLNFYTKYLQKILFLKKYFYPILGILGVVLLFTSSKINTLKKKLVFIRNSSIEDPIFTSAFQFKCVKKYFLNEFEKSNHYSFPHVKLYLIGLTSLSQKSYNKAFLGSANFTFTGIGNPNNSKPINYKTNIESLINTTDNEVCSKLKKFFEEMYNFNFPEHSIEFIGRNIYQDELAKKPSYFNN